MADLGQQLRSICTEVFSELGPHHTEKMYQAAVGREFKRRRVEHAMEVRIPVLYKGEEISCRKADCVVAAVIGGRKRDVVLEFKALQGGIKPDGVYQLEYYMTELGIDDGVAINFPRSRGWEVDPSDFYVDGVRPPSPEPNPSRSAVTVCTVSRTDGEEEERDTSSEEE